MSPLSGKKKRWIRRALWVIVLSSIFVINRSGMHRIPKTERIKELKPWQTFSIVQVEGLLLTPARKLKSGVWFALLADQSGRLFLFVKQWPPNLSKKAGTRLLARGRLMLSKGRNMSVQVTTIQEAKKKVVTLFGKISTLKKPPKNSSIPWRIQLENSTQPMQLVFWFTPTQPLHKGVSIKATGALSVYNEQLQLKIDHPKNIQPTP